MTNNDEEKKQEDALAITFCRNGHPWGYREQLMMSNRALVDIGFMAERKELV